jgi:hypothetical protein
MLLTDKLGNDSHLKLADFVPPSLRNSIDQTRVSLDTVQMEILRLRGAFHLPEKSLCDDLIGSFFEHIYPMEPIVDRQSFMREYENGSVSLLLLQSVLLAASRVSSNPLIFDSDGSNYLTSATFYQRAKALYDAQFESDEISVVQSLILFSRFWEGVDDILGNSFYWTRVAVSVAQGYGFHRNLVGAGDFTPEKVRVSKILWWDLYIKDNSVSVAFGRPRSINLEDCDVPMLKFDDFPNDISRQDADAFLQMVRLSEIMSIVLQEQYSIRAEKTKRNRDNLVITHCDMIMSSWRNSLPSTLQYSPTHYHSLAVNVLNLYYYYAVCLVHRSSMVRTATLNGKQYPSEGIVFKASRIIADIASKLLTSGDIRYCHALTIPIFFMAAMTFVCHMDSHNAGIAKSAKWGYTICYEALKEVGKNHLVAVLIYHSLDRLAKDSRAREKLVSSLARKNDGQQSVAPTPAPVSVHGENTAVPTPSPFPQAPSQYQTPQTGIMVMNSPAQLNHLQTASQLGTPGDIEFSIPQRAVQAQRALRPQEAQPQQILQPNESVELPDLYLFTSTMPTNDATNFDPSDLFPARETRSDTNSDSFQSNDFHMNLPEFDFQNFGNAMSFQNLASLNSYLGEDEATRQSQSNIYNFVN